MTGDPFFFFFSFFFSFDFVFFPFFRHTNTHKQAQRRGNPNDDNIINQHIYIIYHSHSFVLALLDEQQHRAEEYSSTKHHTHTEREGPTSNYIYYNLQQKAKVHKPGEVDHRLSIFSHPTSTSKYLCTVVAFPCTFVINQLINQKT